MSPSEDTIKDVITRLATYIRDELETYATQYQQEHTVPTILKDDTPQIITWHQHLTDLTKTAISEKNSDTTDLINLCLDTTLKGASVILAKWKYQQQQDWFNRAIPISQHSGNQQVEILLKLNLGISSYYNGKFREALTQFEDALSCSELVKQLTPRDPTILATHIRILSTFVATYTQIGEYEKALQKGLQAHSLSKDPLLESNIELRQAVENNLGGAYFRKSMWTKAQETYDASLQLANEAKLSFPISKAEVNIANCLLAKGSLTEALLLYESALSRAKNTANKLDASNWHNNQAAILLDCGLIDEATMACKKALSWSQGDDDNPRVNMASEFTFGKIYLAKSQYSTALDYFISALQQAQQMDIPLYQSISMGYIGRIALELQLWPLATKLLVEAIKIFDKLPQEEVVSIKVNQAIIAICLAQFTRASEILDEAYQIASAISHVPSQAEVLLWQAELRHQQKDLQKANEHVERGLMIVKNSESIIQKYLTRLQSAIDLNLSEGDRLEPLLKLATYELSRGRRAIGLYHLNKIDMKLPEFDLDLIDIMDMEQKLMNI